MNSNRRR